MVLYTVSNATTRKPKGCKAQDTPREHTLYKALEAP